MPCKHQVKGSNPFIGYASTQMTDTSTYGSKRNVKSCCKLSGEVCAEFNPQQSERVKQRFCQISPICQAQKRFLESFRRFMRGHKPMDKSCRVYGNFHIGNHNMIAGRRAYIAVQCYQL